MRSPRSRPGADGRAIYDGTCEIFEAAGEPTQRTKTPGEPLADGFFHGLGHGVGLEVHEAAGHGPRLEGSRSRRATSSRSSRAATGRATAACGSRISSSSPTTGAENLTQYPYDLEP